MKGFANKFNPILFPKDKPSSFLYISGNCIPLQNMKKPALLIILCLAIFISCQKKGVPVITERKTEPPRQNAAMPVNETIAPDTSAGRSIFQASCARCHDLPEPGRYTFSRWEGILSSMMPKARLNNEQKIHITAWLKAKAAR